MADIYLPLADGTKKPPLVSGWQAVPPPSMVVGPGHNRGKRLDDDTDVDADCPEALIAAPRFLPETGRKHGRPSVGITHWWYLCEGAVYEAFTDVVKGLDEDGKAKYPVLIEIRTGPGHYTVVPPSRVPVKNNGGLEVLCWFADGASRTCDFTQLRTAVAYIATTALLARHCIPDGERWKFFEALAGFLLSNIRLPTDAVTRILDTVADIVRDTDTSPRPAEWVKRTDARLKRGEQCSGAPTVAEMIGEHGPAVVAQIRKWFGVTEVDDAPTSAALVIRRMADVPDERLETVFGGRLVCGNFSPLAGPGDVGKGMMAVAIIARLTTGEPFPGETAGRAPMPVAICVVEDSEGRVKSRLRAAGADLDFVYSVGGPEVTVGGLTMPTPMMLGDDSAQLLQVVTKLRVGCLFLETTIEHFGDRSGKSRVTNTGIEIEVRRALAPMRVICKKAQLYGFGALHPRKSHEGAISESISGSAALNNIGRGTMHVYRDPTNEEVRLLLNSKANYLKRMPRTVRFRIVSWDERTNLPCTCIGDQCLHEGRVVWFEGDDLYDERTAEDVWQEIKNQGKTRRDMNVEEAEEFLQRVLKRGLLSLRTITELAKNESITMASLRRAKKNLRVESVMTDTFPATLDGWRLPEF